MTAPDRPPPSDGWPPPSEPPAGGGRPAPPHPPGPERTPLPHPPQPGQPAPPSSGATRGPAAPPDDVLHLDDRPRTLDPRVVAVWRVSIGIAAAVPATVLSAIGVALLGVRGWAVPGVLFLVVAGLVVWYPRARYDRWRWRLTDLAVELERGVVFRRAEALPYFRIQQIDVNQGPVDRLLGLASLQVTSASASGSVTLPGIAADQAPAVRRTLLARAAAAVGEHDTGVRDAV